MFENFNPDKPHFKLSKDESKKLNDGKVIYLFGKNGSGKTTLSREIKDSFPAEVKSFIFNKDYIANNLYIQSNDDDNLKNDLKQDNDKNNLKNNIKQSDKTKKNTFNLFFGHQLVDLKRKINENDLGIDKLKEEFKKFKDTQLLYSKKLEEINLQDLILIKKIEEIDKLSENDFSEKNINEKIAEFNKKLHLIIDYNFRFTLETKINKLIIIVDKQNKIIEEINKMYALESISQNIITFHKQAISLFKEGYVSFLGKEYPIYQIKEFLRISENNKNKKIEDFNEHKKNIFNSIELIIKDSFWKAYNSDKDIKKFINYIKKNNSLELNEKSDRNKKFENLEKITIFPIEKLKEEFKNWLNENKYYLSDKKINLYSLNINYKKYQKIKKDLNNQKIEKYKLICDDFIEKINKHIENISNEKFNIDFKRSRKENEEMITFTFENNNKDFNTLSEGEKSTIAFAYFLTDLEINLKDVKNDFVVYIDDPFDSNDHYKYNNFSKIKLDEESFTDFIENISDSKGVNSKIIISTHNVHILSSFVRSLCSNPNENDFFKKQKENYKDLFFVKEIKKNDDNKISFNEINLNLFFPIENKIETFLSKIFKKIESQILNENEINNEKIQIFKIITCILIKMNDHINSDLRNEYKKYFKEFCPKNVKSLSIQQNYIRETKIDFKSIDSEIIKSVLTELSDGEYDQNIVCYLLSIKDKFDDILKCGDEEKLKRMRHKIFISNSFVDLIEE